MFSSFFMTAPLEMVALTTSQISLLIYFIFSTNIDNNVNRLANNLNFCAK